MINSPLVRLMRKCNTSYIEYSFKYRGKEYYIYKTTDVLEEKCFKHLRHKTGRFCRIYVIDKSKSTIYEVIHKPLNSTEEWVPIQLMYGNTKNLIQHILSLHN